MTQFKKYSAGVYCLHTDKTDLKHGDVVEVTTRRGKAVPVVIWKHLFTRNDDVYYSYIREDGFDRKAWQARKAERLESAAARQHRLSDEHYEKSNKDRDFLSLGEPIKIGHHSEKRHRKAIENAWEQMGKSVECDRKAKEYAERSETIKDRLAYEINLDTPESLDLLEQRIVDLETQREEIKARPHKSWELSNLGANIRRYKKRYETAKRLWDLNFDNAQPTKK